MGIQFLIQTTAETRVESYFYTHRLTRTAAAMARISNLPHAPASEMRTFNFSDAGITCDGRTLPKSQEIAKRMAAKGVPHIEVKTGTAADEVLTALRFALWTDHTPLPRILSISVNRSPFYSNSFLLWLDISQGTQSIFRVGPQHDPTSFFYFFSGTGTSAILSLLVSSIAFRIMGFIFHTPVYVPNPLRLAAIPLIVACMYEISPSIRHRMNYLLGQLPSFSPPTLPPWPDHRFKIEHTAYSGDEF